MPIRKPGFQTILSKEKKEILVQWILHMNNQRYPDTKHELINNCGNVSNYSNYKENIRPQITDQFFENKLLFF